jgi:hypothetical protein
VLVDALQEVGRDAGVDRAVEAAGHDVDGGIAIHGERIAATSAEEKKVDAGSSPA